MSARVSWIWAWPALLVLAGCGGQSEPEQYNLSGNITFKGQPIAGGMIYFEPAEGNSGHTGYALISNGHFDTAADGGKGHAGGKIACRIEPGGNRTEPILDDNVAPPPKPFNAWQEIVDLPQEDSTRDFAVPDDADKPAPAPPQNTEA